VRYGWRVKAENFAQYVLAEYTTFWHHPNGACYGDSDWVPNPPQDAVSDAKAATPAVGSSDPKDGTFGTVGDVDTPATVTSVVNNSDGSVTVTYSDGTVVINFEDGSTKTTYGSDGSVVWTIPGIDTGGNVAETGIVDTSGVTTSGDPSGRMNWRELRR
jgi:hypothetical protein